MRTLAAPSLGMSRVFILSVSLTWGAIGCSSEQPGLSPEPDSATLPHSALNGIHPTVSSNDRGESTPLKRVEARHIVDEIGIEQDPETPQMKMACGGCHAFSDPAAFTHRTWDHSLPYVYRVLHEYHGGDPAGISLEQALTYYRRHAATRLPAPPLYPKHRPALRPERVSPDSEGRIVVDLATDKGRLRAVDMLNGQVLSRSVSGEWNGKHVGNHPVRVIHLTDDSFLKGPFLTADLGIFRAADTDSGGVFRVAKEQRQALLKDVGRVSALIPGDVTGDGILDVVVAVFGWQSTGGLYVLEGTDDPTVFEPRRLSNQAGYVDLDVADLNGDGRLEIVALVAQHTESIELWETRGEKLTPRRIFQAPTPLWGHLGLKVIDLDGDGDQDILFWNGDTLDAPRVAAFQGVHVLWQTSGAFTREQLAILPGIHDVSVADLNRDGRLDFVAVANLPPKIADSLGSDQAPQTDAIEFESVIQGLQQPTRSFTVQSLLSGQPCISTVSIDDATPGSPTIYLGSFGMGWSLFGHSGLHSARDGDICSVGDVYRLVPGTQQPTRPTTPRDEIARAKQIRALTRIVNNDPQDALNRVKLGNVLLADAQYQAAQDMFQDAIDADPEEKAAYLNLALVLDYRGRTNEAEGPLREVLQRYPTYADAHSQLSIILVKKRQPQIALEHIETALSLDGDQSNYHFNKGAILAGLKKFSDAKKSYEEGLRLDPGNQLGLDAIRRLQTVP